MDTIIENQSLNKGELKILKKLKNAKKKADKKKALAKKKKPQWNAPKKKKADNIRLRKEYVNPTPVGEKKDVNALKLPKQYDPAFVEAAWYPWWEKQGFFDSENFDDHDDRERFVLLIPPPNVTGYLHIGHALSFSIQDTICRYLRMDNKRVVWIPGTDHAGIATQSVVERQLAKEGIYKNDIGREAFLEKIWQWRNEKGGRILDQFKRMGFSLDWSRTFFTMDDNLSRAVIEAFVRFHNDGLIYRDNRLVNWSCALKTAISNIECDNLEIDSPKKIKVPGYDKPVEFGYLWDFAYKVVDSDDEIIVSTTRPETMLGDTAVAVHPDDERYKKYHGKMLQHPFIDRQIPVITDSITVEMELGTGAVKITPSHDPNDYETGKRHNLEFINILTDDGYLNDECGEEYAGLHRYAAREKVLKDLDAKGLYRGKKPKQMVLSKCSRSGDIIEPIIRPQWYVNIETMATKAKEALETGDLIIEPESSHHVWYHYMGNPEPWCISRQLWWGHRCPAWLIIENGIPKPSEEQDSWIIARNEEEAQKLAKEKLGHDNFELQQDEDVLDTWFSSGLLPFSVMGWPDETPDLSNYYPMDLLETGSDILFFWVARMVMMGIQLTGKLPFPRVFLHSMVRDANGEKMSKAKGNVIDPIDVIEGTTLENLHNTIKNGNLPTDEIEKAIEMQKRIFPNGIPECGTDALRFGLLSYMNQGRDIHLDIKRIEGYRNFCNKIWNGFNLGKIFMGDYHPSSTATSGGESEFDYWILHQLNQTVATVRESLDSYNFGAAASAIHSFWLYNFCDVYLEAAKPTIYNKTNPDEEAQQAVRHTTYTVIETFLRLLHPMSPYITEELWQRLPPYENKPDSICIASYPNIMRGWEHPDASANVELLQSILVPIRRLLAENNMTKKQNPKVTIASKNENIQALFNQYQDLIINLCFLAEAHFTTDDTLEGKYAKETVEFETEKEGQCKVDLYLSLE